MVLLRLLLVAYLTLPFLPAFAQQTPAKPNRYWTLLTDPACPVSPMYSRMAPNVSTEMRVLYFPTAKDAKLRDAKSLTLLAGFNSPKFWHSSESYEFTRKGDYWEATVPLEKLNPSYAIFLVKDPTTGTVDDNGGKYWDVVFCNPAGEKDQGLRYQAESYTGASWSSGIHRAIDYDTAIKILRTQVEADIQRHRAPFAQTDLWHIEAQRDGDTPQAWAKVSDEVATFMEKYKDDPPVLLQVSNFLNMYEQKLPPAFVDQTADFLDSHLKNDKFSFRAQIELNRAMREPDAQRRLAALDAAIAKIPPAQLPSYAQQYRFIALVQLEDVAGAEAALAKFREARANDKNTIYANDFNDDITLAQLYIKKKVKLDQAISFLNEARDKELKAGLPEDIVRQQESYRASFRAQAYLAMQKPDLALQELTRYPNSEKNASDYAILAQAYSARGEKQKALDSYFEAALMPSNNDVQYRADAEQYYVKQHFGKQKQFDPEFERRRQLRFQAAKYVPKLVDQSCPDLSFTTAKGDKLTPASLKSKTVVLNFWSPG